MMQKPLTLVFIFFVFLSFTGQAQTLEELTTMDKKYKACLDRGINMADCSQLYYSQMDSLVNVVYHNLQRSITQSEKAGLKNEQQKWLVKRDAYFRKVDKKFEAENSSGFAGKDSRMIAIDEKAQFVRKRVEELLKNLDNI